MIWEDLASAAVVVLSVLLVPRGLWCQLDIWGLPRRAALGFLPPYDLAAPVGAAFFFGLRAQMHQTTGVHLRPKAVFLSSPYLLTVLYFGSIGGF